MLLIIISMLYSSSSKSIPKGSAKQNKQRSRMSPGNNINKTETEIFSWEYPRQEQMLLMVGVGKIRRKEPIGLDGHTHTSCL